MAQLKKNGKKNKYVTNLSKGALVAVKNNNFIHTLLFWRQASDQNKLKNILN